MGVPHNKDYSILGFILGSPYFGKLPLGPDSVVLQEMWQYRLDLALQLLVSHLQ